MPIESGTTLGPYRVIEPIGAGGMGEVYRARDTKLNRDVALKVLPETFVDDPERLARFQREAEVLASLNHPNIAHIYGLEDSGGTTAIVLELVEGPTLAERVKQGAIPLDEALDLAHQIAAALEAAHALGIVHRDLKPANIKITPDGVVKVLDFGLAKAFATGEGTDAESSLSPTLTKGTALGVILGTAAYMSPEQAKGKPVDARTDVWALGAVLFEMLAGERAFKGEDVSDTLVSVFRDDPEWSKLPRDVPPRITQAMRVCLSKDAKERVRDIAAIRLAMKGAFETTATSVGEIPTPARGSWTPWVVAAALIALAVVAMALWKGDTVEPPPVVRFALTLPDGQNLASRTSGLPVFDISRDGLRLVYTTDEHTYLRELSDAAPRPIPGIDEFALNPLFSPDGESIVYMTAAEHLERIGVGGGTPVLITTFDSLPPPIGWGGDNAVFFGGGNGVYRVSANGGQPEKLFSLDEAVTRPHLLPDGDTVLFSLGLGGSGRVTVRSLSSGAQKELFPGQYAYYVPTGHIVFQQRNTVYGVGFDLDDWDVIGNPVALQEGLGGERAAFVVSESGTLVFSPGNIAALERRLGLADAQGDVELLDMPPAEYLSPRISPDGSRFAVQSGGFGDSSTIWVSSFSGEEAMRQLTFEGNNERPVWTPDGTRIAFASDRDGPVSLYWQRADGSGVAERLTTADDGVAHYPSSFSPDGKLLVYMVHHGDDNQENWDVWSVSTEDGSAEKLYDLPDGVHTSPELSPDGRWIAYSSGEQAATQDVYVEPFPPTGARQRISRNGAYWPTWSPTGDALFYRPVSGVRDLVINRVDIVAEPEFRFTNERTLPIEGFVIVSFYRDYDVTPDGEKLLMVFPAERAEESTQRPRPSLQIVLNWSEELKARVPTK